MRTFFCAALFLLTMGLTAQAGPMNELDYQGKVLVDEIPFTGNGLFKFAISDTGSTTNYWANDGTGSGEPAGSNTIAVWNGLFSVVLGASPMTGIDPSIFNTTSSLYLRVWFDSGSGFNEMLPSQKIVGGAFSLNALFLNGWSASEIQSNSVMAATNAITLAGDVTGAPHANAIAAGVIVDADVNAAAAIAGTKVTAGTTSTRGTLQLESGTTGTNAIGPGHPSLNAFSTVNSQVATTPGSGFGITGAGTVSIGVSGTNIVITGASAALPNLDNVIWVGLNGTPAGPGTIAAPYATPQQGYNAAAATFTGAPSTVVIAGGDYAAAGLGLTMSSGTVHVLGMHRPRIDMLTVTSPGAPLLGGYQNVEGIVLDAPAGVAPGAGSVRFHNCKFNEGAGVFGGFVIFQDCRLVHSETNGAALAIATLPGTAAFNVGVYQSSLENRSESTGAIEIGYPGMELPNVQDLEVIGCEIVNIVGAFGPPGVPGPAIQDWSPFHGLGFPYKLFTHNYIKGPLTDSEGGFAAPAIADPGVAPAGYPPGTGPFLAVYHNVIWGSAGLAPGGAAHVQFYGNNTMLGGIINNVGGPVGWLQAGAGTGPDAAGNIEHELLFPAPLPGSWDD